MNEHTVWEPSGLALYTNLHKEFYPAIFMHSQSRLDRRFGDSQIIRLSRSPIFADPYS